MGLFSRKTENDAIDGSWIRANALVIAADAPPQGAPYFGPYSHGEIQVLVDTSATGRHKLTATFRYATTRWVVAGMDVPIAIDPTRPDTFVVDWSAVPTMFQLVEANHPALADPFAASRRVAAAVGITPSEKTASRLERFQQAVAEAATKPAPPGRLRAVAMTVTIRGRYESGSDADGSSSGSGVSFSASSAAVLSVCVPGRSPYAVTVSKFKFPAKRLSIPGEPMPVLVSTTNPSDVEILWAEMPDLGDQIGARMADSMRSNNQLIAAMGAQYQEAIAQAVANPPQAPATAYQGTGMPPQARQLMIENLKRSLLYVTNPAQRQMVLDQYRAMGLDITPEELGF